MECCWVGACVVFTQRRGGVPRILLQHRHPSIWHGQAEHGAGMLGLPGGTRRRRVTARHPTAAHPHDVHIPAAPGGSSGPEPPILTAWREAVEETAPYTALTLPRFRGAVQQALFLEQHWVFVVDLARLEGALPEDWTGQVARSPLLCEVATSRFPTGHVWVDATQLQRMLAGGSGEPDWPPLWPVLVQPLSIIQYATTLAAVYPPPPQVLLLAHPRPRLHLYHGTTESAARAILASGHIRPSLTGAANVVCTRACRRHRVCTCGPMLGQGVYLALEDKAESNAGRAAAAAAEAEATSADGSARQRVTGAVLECAVFLGACKVAAHGSRCPCGCKLEGGVDHVGSWHTAERFDSIFLPGGGRAAKRPEWCVRNGAHVLPLRMKLVDWDAPSRKMLSGGDYFVPPLT